MQNKKDGIVPIHGKDYKTVAQRVLEVNADYRADNKLEIKTEIVRLDENMVVMKAVAVIDGKEFHGHAYELFNASELNAVSGIEVCETSCIGRALGLAGYGTVDSIDSAETVQRSISQQSKGEVQKPIRKMDITEDIVVINNGDNAGKPLKDLDKDTLIWIRDKSSLSEEVKLFVHNYIKSKFETEIEEAPLNIGS